MSLKSAEVRHRHGCSHKQMFLLSDDEQYRFHWCPSMSKAITGLINQRKQVFRWAVTFVSDWQHVIGAQLNEWKVVFTDYRVCLDIYTF